MWWRTSCTITTAVTAARKLEEKPKEKPKDAGNGDGEKVKS